MLALFIYIIGVFFKLFFEAVEAIEFGSVEGIRVIGVNKFEEIFYGVLL